MFLLCRQEYNYVPEKKSQYFIREDVFNRQASVVYNELLSPLRKSIVKKQFSHSQRYLMLQKFSYTFLIKLI